MNPSRILSNNTVDNSGNTMVIPDSNTLEVSGNKSINNRINNIQIIPKNNNTNYLCTKLISLIILHNSM